MLSGVRTQFGRIFSNSSTPKASAAASDQRIETVSVQSQNSGENDRSEVGGTMQTLFLSHGSPMLPIEYEDPARQFLVDLPKTIGKPKAVLMISGHWDTSVPTVNAMRKNETIHDFYGFPRELYKLRYDAPGSPELSQRVLQLLHEGGFPTAKADAKRGLDHGAWVPMLLMYPDLDVPVVQLSIQCRKDEAYHYRLGQALAPLKNEGVLVIGSGAATHNLRMVDPEATKIASWTTDFDGWFADAILNNKYDDIINYRQKSPYARLAHPTPDHFLPVIVALGAAGKDSINKHIHSSFSFGTMSMSSFSFESPSPALNAAA